ncbi:MAG: radical SAM protein [Desulfuromonadales bacterium]|nr:radical SAM protein [Desulfuromonadales bacterium]
MSLDALIIADYGTDSLSGSSPLRLTLDGQTADIQVVYNYLANGGRRVDFPPEEQHQLSWGSAPRLNGIALLSTLLENGYRAVLVNDFARDHQHFVAALEEKPKAIIISTTFIVTRQALGALVGEVRRLAPDIPLLVGGPLVTQSCRIRDRGDERLFQAPELRETYLFCGGDDPESDLWFTDLNGQPALGAALDRLLIGESLQGIPGTAWRSDTGDYVFERQQASSGSPPPIRWDLLPDSIFQPGVVPLQASSGCPYRCAFCNFVKDHQQSYAKSIDQIIGEMEAVARRGVRYVWFVDDIFCLGRSDLNAFSRAIIQAGLDLQWMTFIRADTVRNVDLNLLRQAGCLELQFGLESADPQVLAAMNKKADPQMYQQSIHRTLAAGINVSAYFLFGHPGESEQSAATTIEFMRENQYPELPGSLSWSIYPFLLVPLSPIFEEQQRQRYQLEGYMWQWRHAGMDSAGAMQQIRKAVMALNDSAPIYRGDNLPMLAALPSPVRKAFFRARLRLAKTKADQQTIYHTFDEILHGCR